MTPAQHDALAQIQDQLSRLARHDDESLVHDRWIRQRYQSGTAPRYSAARATAVRTAWHEAGHAVAALTAGARFSSASIYPSAPAGRRGTEGRVHGIAAAGEHAFVIDAAGQIAERLMDWTTLDRDDELAAWLGRWRADGGDARRFRQSIGSRFGTDEVAAWRYSETQLTPHRLAIRQVARGLLVHPRHLPYPVVAALADIGR